MRLFFIRHGESHSNADPRAVALPEHQGDRLTERGHEQARAAADALADLKLDRLLSSPMRRARETAEPLAERLRMDVEIDEGIHELREGEDYLALPPEEQKLRRWSIRMAKHGDDPDHAEPGGESFNDVVSRVHAFKRRLQSCGDETVLAVSHGIFQRFFLFDSLLEGDFRAADVGRLWQLRTRNTGVSLFEHGIRHHTADPETGDWVCVAWMAPVQAASQI